MQRQSHHLAQAQAESDHGQERRDKESQDTWQGAGRRQRLQEYKESQKVNLIGLTTMLDKDNNEVKCGFVYGLDPTFADFNFVEASDIKDSGSSDGNVIFTAALTPPSLYQKVYYRAATYDGVYYNYDKSEPCNFTVRASLEVSPEYLDFKEVPLGESKQLSIEVKNTGFDPVMYSISIPDGTSFIATETEIN